MSNKNLAIVKSIPRESAIGLSEFRNLSSGNIKGAKMNRTKLGRCNDRLRALGSKATGKLKTGLAVFVPNPYFESESSLPSEFEYVRKMKEITKQELFEIKHGRPKGYYTDALWREGTSLSDDNLTFFQKFKVKLNDGSTFFDLDNPMDEVAFTLLKEHKLVALSNNPEDRRAKPKAQWYIADINESEKEKYAKRKLYNSAVKDLNNEKFVPSLQKKVAKALQLVKGDTSTITDEKLYLVLDNYLEEAISSVDKESNIHNFQRMYDLTKTPDGRTELEARAFLEDLVLYRLVTDTKGTYKWVSKNMIIGQRKEEAVDWLLDPKKQPEHDELKLQLKSKLLR